jgi:hypothetical protein
LPEASGSSFVLYLNGNSSRDALLFGFVVSLIDNFSFRSWIYAQSDTPRPVTISGSRDGFWFALPPLACSPKPEG